ncbi:hypothetical protein BZG36_00305 [Bifiguratus adelaidae]|uniref:PHD-type domain-containing protein n=1 Tax=Bifiguratus adelaidae TaxID=1938954 RepID=A0A261Y7X5_9FUNG|nr:hypothetical protein BZG36_00305 [Bifiguratus adelaidae]
METSVSARYNSNQQNNLPLSNKSKLTSQSQNLSSGTVKKVDMLKSKANITTASISSDTTHGDNVQHKYKVNKAAQGYMAKVSTVTVSTSNNLNPNARLKRRHDGTQAQSDMISANNSPAYTQVSLDIHNVDIQEKKQRRNPDESLYRKGPPEEINPSLTKSRPKNSGGKVRSSSTLKFVPFVSPGEPRMRGETLQKRASTPSLSSQGAKECLARAISTHGNFKHVKSTSAPGGAEANVDRRSKENRTMAMTIDNMNNVKERTSRMALAELQSNERPSVIPLTKEQVESVEKRRAEISMNSDFNHTNKASFVPQQLSQVSRFQNNVSDDFAPILSKPHEKPAAHQSYASEKKRLVFRSPITARRYRKVRHEPPGKHADTVSLFNQAIIRQRHGPIADRYKIQPNGFTTMNLTQFTSIPPRPRLYRTCDTLWANALIKRARAFSVHLDAQNSSKDNITTLSAILRQRLQAAKRKVFKSPSIQQRFGTLEDDKPSSSSRCRPALPTAPENNPSRRGDHFGLWDREPYRYQPQRKRGWGQVVGCGKGLWDNPQQHLTFSHSTLFGVSFKSRSSRRRRIGKTRKGFEASGHSPFLSPGQRILPPKTFYDDEELLNGGKKRSQLHSRKGRALLSESSARSSKEEKRKRAKSHRQSLNSRELPDSSFADWEDTSLLLSDMPEGDNESILAQLVAQSGLSMGEDDEATKSCPHCGKMFEEILSLSRHESSCGRKERFRSARAKRKDESDIETVSESQSDEGEFVEEDEEDDGENDAIIDCICNSQEDEGSMVQCDRCEAWLHMACLGLTKKLIGDDEYYCPKCTGTVEEYLSKRKKGARRRKPLAQTTFYRRSGKTRAREVYSASPKAERVVHVYDNPFSSDEELDNSDVDIQAHPATPTLSSISPSSPRSHRLTINSALPSTPRTATRMWDLCTTPTRSGPSMTPGTATRSQSAIITRSNGYSSDESDEVDLLHLAAMNHEMNISPVRRTSIRPSEPTSTGRLLQVDSSFIFDRSPIMQSPSRVIQRAREHYQSPGSEFVSFSNMGPAWDTDLGLEGDSSFFLASNGDVMGTSHVSSFLE